jgi:hypothetical protein
LPLLLCKLYLVGLRLLNLPVPELFGNRLI